MDKIAKKFLQDCKSRDECKRAEKKLIDELGKKEAEKIILYHCGYSTGQKSWECRDCAILDNEEFHDRLNQRYMRESNKE
jgi:hypothetical protein